MLSIDMKNAVAHQDSYFGAFMKADNFTVLLLRLILKADSDNKELLRKGFPVEVMMVDLYRDGCPYTNEVADDGCRVVDWQKLEQMARERS